MTMHHILCGEDITLIKMSQKYTQSFSHSHLEEAEILALIGAAAYTFQSDPIKGTEAALTMMLHMGLPDLMNVVEDYMSDILSASPSSALLKEMAACSLGLISCEEEIAEVKKGASSYVKDTAMLLNMIKPIYGQDVTMAVDRFLSLYQTSPDDNLEFIRPLLPLTKVGSLAVIEAGQQATRRDEKPKKTKNPKPQSSAATQAIVP